MYDLSGKLWDPKRCTLSLSRTYILDVHVGFAINLVLCVSDASPACIQYTTQSSDVSYKCVLCQMVCTLQSSMHLLYYDVICDVYHVSNIIYLLYDALCDASTVPMTEFVMY